MALEEKSLKEAQRQKAREDAKQRLSTGMHRAVIPEV
jgi:hypothetical protein